MKRILSVVVFAVSTVALAQAAKAPAPTGPSAVEVAGLEKAPVLQSTFKLACPAGTSQVGGVKTNMSMMACFKIGPEGTRVFHGPMITLYASGKVEAVGTNENGLRSGKWSFFDENGNKTGDTEFRGSNYHGRRMTFFANGQPKTEEFWVEGKRQGPQKSWSEAGAVTVVNYLDDRPATN